MKHFLSLFLIACFFCSAPAQDYHLVYKTNFAGFKLDSLNSKDFETVFLKGHQHILVFKDKRSISYLLAEDNYTKNIKLKLCDKKRKQYKNIELSYIESDSTYKYKPYHRIWKDQKANAEKELGFSNSKIEYSQETKTINGFDCKLAYLVTKESKTAIWYTEAFHYNWAFINHHFLIPGTIILVQSKKDTKPFFELLERKPLEIQNTKLDQENLNQILKNWRKSH